MHTHSVAATALSTLADELPAIHYYVAMFGGPVAVAPYATYGTDELAGHVVAALRGRTACLMANHGAVTTGADLKSALTASRYLEWLCEVYLRALMAGGAERSPRLLPADEIERVAGAARLRTAGAGGGRVSGRRGLAAAFVGARDVGRPRVPVRAVVGDDDRGPGVPVRVERRQRRAV